MPDTPNTPDMPEASAWAPGEGIPIPGPVGDPGPAGPPPNLDIGTVTEGIDAAATITGTTPDYTLNLVLPQGDPGPRGVAGDPGLFASVNVTLLPSGATPTATISGPGEAQVLELGIPAGEAGEDGEPGPPGPISAIEVDPSGLSVFKGMSTVPGDEGTAQFYPFEPSRTIAAVLDPDNGIRFNYVPSYVRLRRTQDEAASSPHITSWQEAAGSSTTSFNAATPTIVKVPQGAVSVEITFQMLAEVTNPGDVVQCELLKGGNSLVPKVIATSSVGSIHLSSGVLLTASGDEYSVRVTSDSLDTIKYDSSWLEAKFY